MAEYIDLDPGSSRLFAIGDIHGCVPELEALLSHLKAAEGLSAEDRVVFMGDYIDRGPNSKGVIEFLLQFRKDFPATIFLRGNHEDMMIDFLDLAEGDQGAVCLLNGGDYTADSYGVSLDLDDEGKKNALKEVMPEEHKEFLRSLANYVITPKYVFAHAGVDPLRDLKFQHSHDLFWIRDEFIVNLHYFQRTVIFGHTPFHDIMFHLPYKIGIDTGLVYGNKLSAIELTGEKAFQVANGTADVIVSSFEDHEGFSRPQL